MKNVGKLFLSIVACELVGIAGTPFTISAIPTWYEGLNKPFFAPPNWIFGPVWTLLYLLMGVSLYLLWVSHAPKKRVQTARTYFFAQLFFNFIWSPVFFGLQSPLLGLIVIVLLWILIVRSIQLLLPISKIAGYLLLPYLAWVSFATLLNFAILVLN